MPLALLRKPRSGALEPTVPIGQPMPPMQRIPEPVDMVGRYTGQVHGALGDGTSPETVHVIPSQPGPSMGNAPGEPGYAQGGIFSVGPDLGNPWGGIDQGDNSSGGRGTNGGLWGWGGQPNGGQTQRPGGYNPYRGGGGRQYYNPGYVNTYGGGQTYGGQQPFNWDPFGTGGGQTVYTPQSSYSGDPALAYWNAQNAGLGARFNLLGSRGLQLGAQQNALNANLGVLNAQRAALPYSAAQRQAQSRVIDLSALRNQSQRGVLQQANANDQARLGELQGIYAASQNVPDILAAGEAQNAYNAENRRDQALGVSAPTNVVLPPGASTTQPGVRGAIQTQEEALTRRANYQNPIRQAQLSIAQNAVQMQDTDVQAAQLEAQRAGLSLAEANQLVQEAQLNSGYAQNEASAAGLGVNSANLGVEQADLMGQLAQHPPAPGLVAYTDPETGQSQWVTPDERNRLQAQYQYGPYGAFVRDLSQQLYGTTTGANLTLGQVQTAFRRGAFGTGQAAEDAVRAYVQRLRPNLSAEDLDRLVTSITGGRVGGADVVIG